jgi:glucose-1-phosphate thymidylyltransferase
MIKQAVILAAGEGQRLQPFTATSPKVMIKVVNRPILGYVVDALKRAGIRDIILVVGYKKERIIDYFGDGSSRGVKIRYVEQKQQLGTAHALKQAEDLIEDTFIVLSGDNVIDSETLACIEEPWTLLYQSVREVSKYGAVILEDGKVVAIVEKPVEETSHLANTGIYALKKEIFGKIGDEISLVAVLNSIATELKIEAVENRGLWMDIVYPWDILKVNEHAMRFSGKSIAGRIEDRTTIIGDVRIGKNTIIRGNTYIKGPVIIGEGCEIGPNAVIMPSTSIGDNVKLQAQTYIANSVINGGVIIAAGSYLENSVVSSGCLIGARFTASSGLAEIMVGEEYHSLGTGVFIGEGCLIGANVLAEPGTIIGSNATIAPMRSIRGKIPPASRVL